MVDDPPDDVTPFLPTPLIARPPRSGGPETPILRVTAGQDILRFIEIGGTLEIGRDIGCGLSLNDASVSRRHVRVHADADGFLLEDLGSRNGTLLNGQPVESACVRLVAGDRLEVGTVPLRFDFVRADELAHLRGVVERLTASGRDSLTGLSTRAYLEDDLPRLVEECRRAARPLSAVFVDVDHFKSINDRFGHAMGDDVLRQLSRILAYSVRAREACVRYGGDEVVVVLDGSNENQAVVVADRLRQLVESHRWSTLTEGLAVTVSCGVAEWQPGEDARHWLDRADRAVYVAKGRGRNTVWRGSQSEPA
jgi:diguanylate cyclase (GGDEF)-like protein